MRAKKTITYGLLVGLVALGLTGCGRTPLNPEGEDDGAGKLSVTVKDSQGPVAGANVEIFAADGHSAATSVQSDESGVALIASLPAGDGYTASAEHAGATGKASSVTISKGQTTSVVITLSVGAGPGGIIAGTVKVADTDRALPGARVEVVGANLSTVADDTGHYKLDNVPVGQQTIRATYAGFFDGVRDLAVKAGTSNSLVIDLAPQSAGARAQNTVITTATPGREVDRWHNPVNDVRPSNAWSAVVNRSSGNYLIADVSKSAAVELTEKGTTLASFNATAWYKLGIGGVHSPRGASYTTSGNVLVADTGSNRIVEIDRNDNKVWEYKTRLNAPRWAERQRNGNTLIADTGNNRIVEINSTGTPVWGLGDGTTNIVNHPSFVQKLANGNVLVTDSGNNRVMEINADGKMVWMIGGGRTLSGDDPAGLSNPNCAVRLPSGNTLIADTGNNRVIELDKAGTVVWKMAAPAPLFVDRL